MSWSETFLQVLKDNDVRLLTHLPPKGVTPPIQGIPHSRAQRDGRGEAPPRPGLGSGGAGGGGGFKTPPPTKGPRRGARGNERAQTFPECAQEQGRRPLPFFPQNCAPPADRGLSLCGANG